MKTLTKRILLSSVIAASVTSAGASNDNESKGLQPLDQINFAYNGDQSRIGIGINEEGEFIGDC